MSNEEVDFWRILSFQLKRIIPVMINWNSGKLIGSNPLILVTDDQSIITAKSSLITLITIDFHKFYKHDSIKITNSYNRLLVSSINHARIYGQNFSKNNFDKSACECFWRSNFSRNFPKSVWKLFWQFWRFEKIFQISLQKLLFLSA